MKLVKRHWFECHFKIIYVDYCDRIQLVYQFVLSVAFLEVSEVNHIAVDEDIFEKNFSHSA